MSSVHVVISCAVALLTLSIAAAETSCIQNGDLDFRPDEFNCSVFYRCVNDVLHTFVCEPGTVYSPVALGCVHIGSEHDSCTEGWPTVCGSRSSGLIPHPTKCSQYYNCSAPPMKAGWEDGLQECYPPQLYNTDTELCEHFTMVDCEGREEPLGECEYEMHKNPQGPGTPCNILYPSCRGFQDGMNVEPSRLNSPYFTVCVSERLVYLGYCADGRLYDPDLKTCVDQNKK